MHDGSVQCLVDYGENVIVKDVRSVLLNYFTYVRKALGDKFDFKIPIRHIHKAWHPSGVGVGTLPVYTTLTRRLLQFHCGTSVGAAAVTAPVGMTWVAPRPRQAAREFQRHALTRRDARCYTLTVTPLRSLDSCSTHLTLWAVDIKITDISIEGQATVTYEFLSGNWSRNYVFLT